MEVAVISESQSLSGKSTSSIFFEGIERCHYVNSPWQQNFWIWTNRGMNFLGMFALRTKTVAHTFLPSFDNQNCSLRQEMLLRSRNFGTILQSSKNVNSCLFFWQAAFSLCLPRATSCLSQLGFCLRMTWTLANWASQPKKSASKGRGFFRAL